MFRIVIVAILLAAIAIPTVLFATQTPQGTEARVAAYKHEDGRVEFAIQIKEGNEWASRVLPDSRTLSANAPTGRWLSSSPVIVPTASPRFTPITSPFFLSRAKQGLFSERDLAFSTELAPGGGGEYTGRLVTLAWLTGGTDSQDLVATLTLKCEAGYTNYDNYDEEGNALPSSWVPGEMLGWIHLHTPETSSFTRHDYKQSAGIVVTVQDPVWGENSGPLPGTPQSRQWTFYEGNWIDDEIITAMRKYETLTVRVLNSQSKFVTAEFAAQRLFETPVQSNFDHCGEY